jgi:peptidoglycan/xylan/chitin deacetylase (PgdA/CDA1 family)
VRETAYDISVRSPFAALKKRPLKLALKIDLDTYHGTRDGVPPLLRLLDRHKVRATFLFSLGPDHTGRAIRRVFRRGFLQKVARTSVASHYGLRTLLYGTLLPGPDIGKRCAALMRSVRDAGHETGIHTYDHVEWQDRVARASEDWTRRQMQQACAAYETIFGSPPHTHGAAGWQMNAHAFRYADELEFGYCSDSRGTQPFVPVIDGHALRCAQLPTTLPTLDELIGIDGITETNVARHLLQLTSHAPVSGHVYTLHAELEGQRLGSVFDELLAGWRAQGYTLTTLADYAQSLQLNALPSHNIEMGTVPGRSGTLCVQGAAVTA